MNRILTLEQRASFYHQAFPERPPPMADGYLEGLSVYGEWLYGVWLIGNDYRNGSDYYGAYPHGYLDRVRLLFPDMIKKETLHLFSGSLSTSTNVFPGELFDIRFAAEAAKPKQDAYHLHDYYGARKFSIILADPPYSGEDAKHYGTPMVNRNRVVAECARSLTRGGFLVWLDQAFPMFRKDQLKLVGTIGLVRSTNHRVRFVFIWRRL